MTVRARVCLCNGVFVGCGDNGIAGDDDGLAKGGGLAKGRSLSVLPADATQCDGKCVFVHVSRIDP